MAKMPTLKVDVRVIKMKPETKIRTGLRELLEELKLLRALETATRNADEQRCVKSLNQRDALERLDVFRYRMMA